MDRAPQDSTDALRSLSEILDAVQAAAKDGRASVEDILTQVGDHSFSPIILVPALILVSPLSGIFGLPTIGALFIFLITVQKLVGRPHVWLPKVIKRRSVAAERLDRAIAWLRPICAWIDARMAIRLTWLVTRGANVATLLTIIAITMVIPMLEILPFITSVLATAIAFFAIGLLARDGVFIVLGYIWVSASSGMAYWLIA
ncbi:exopolysaccharide biosynthesis protein [Litorivita sp. NS0012-18]|uniref:exopolysaccharide biosynthesis protein n=1 Tax=Litorivita sp. NS0012-18 TaxID=3127655 RepID=UPI003102BD81